MPELYIGLMSGTSADSIDAVLVDFANPVPTLVAHNETDLSTQLKQNIKRLAHSGNNEIDLTCELDRTLGHLFAQSVNALLAKAKMNPSDIKAIGSHGQTIRHRPPAANRQSETAFTLQIGDPSTIAELTNITTVADFRGRDIAAGGQGAPLAPAFHHAVFRGNVNRAIVNIGGMSNISLLQRTKSISGYDTGPGNVLLDDWIHLNQGKAYDDNGNWAQQGTASIPLLKHLLRHSFFSQTAPKSTGREDFNMGWLSAQLDKHGAEISPVDVQATLVELTAQSISHEIQTQRDVINEVYICGGGAFNGYLMTRLEQLLHPATVASTEQLGINPQRVEAVAFAWLAKRYMDGLPGNCPAVTGASKEVILGGAYKA